MKIFPFFLRIPKVRFAFVMVSVLTFGSLMTDSAVAVTDTFSGTGTTSWDLGTNWSTGTPAGAGDTALFNGPVNASAEIVTLDANQAALGIQIATGEGAVTFSSTAAAANGANSLTLGTGGITNNGSGSLTLNANVIVNGNQTWSGTSAILVNDSLTGTGNINFTTRVTASNALAGSVTGAATVSANGDLNGNFLNTFSGGITLAATTIGLQGAAGTPVTDNSTLTFSAGNTNLYTNGLSQVYNGAVTSTTGGIMGTIGSGNLTFNGTSDNANLSVVTPNGSASTQTFTYLNKTSSSSVHAIGGNLTISNYNTVQLAGTGGDQIANGTTVTFNTGSVLDLHGNNETVSNVTGGAGTITNTVAATTSTLTLGAASGTFSGVMNNGAGTLALTKNGSGALTLNGASAYTGATNLNGGSTTVSNTGSLGNGSAVTLSGGASLTYGNLGTLINLQSIGATATASSGTSTAQLAIDGNTGTRWESAQSDPQYLKVDLKGNYTIATAQISFETAGAKNFVLQTGTSGGHRCPGRHQFEWLYYRSHRHQPSELQRCSLYHL